MSAMPSLPLSALGALLFASVASAQLWTVYVALLLSLNKCARQLYKSGRARANPYRGHDSLLRTRLDPIVSPGKVAGHVHMFSGSSAITPTMTYDKARQGCTTNKMSEDKSGWVPGLLFRLGGA